MSERQLNRIINQDFPWLWATCRWWNPRDSTLRIKVVDPRGDLFLASFLNQPYSTDFDVWIRTGNLDSKKTIGGMLRKVTSDKDQTWGRSILDLTMGDWVDNIVIFTEFKNWNLADPGIRYPDNILLYRSKVKLGQTLTKIVNEITV